MKQILNKILYEMEHGDDVVIVTVIDSDGSTPRGVGAKMLVGKRGLILGTVGGGAVEQEALGLSQTALAEKRSFLHRYLLKPNPGEDIGMVCGGDLTLLFQYVPADSKAWYDVICAALANVENGVESWLINDLQGGVPAVWTKAQTGKNDSDGRLNLEWLAQNSPMRDENRFVEPIALGERVLIFGAGHIAQQLVKLLPALDFIPVVYDDRKEFAKEELFPQAKTVICADYDDIAAHLNVTGDDYVVVMTEGHSHDFSVQAQIMQGPYAYLGVIGSRSKIVAVNAKLKALGITDEALATVHTPIGTAIRAVTPAELAISIAGELILERAQIRTPIKKQSAGCPMR